MCRDFYRWNRARVNNTTSKTRTDAFPVVEVAARLSIGWNFVTATPPSSLRANLAVSPRPNPPMDAKTGHLKGGGLSGSPPFIDLMSFRMAFLGWALLLAFVVIVLDV